MHFIAKIATDLASHLRQFAYRSSANQSPFSVPALGQLPVLESGALGLEYARISDPSAVYHGYRVDRIPGQCEPQALQVRLTAAARTDCGCVRQHNEDTVSSGLLPLADGSMAHLSFVADGMGGHAVGGYAAQVAVQAACEYLWQAVESQQLTGTSDWHSILSAAVDTANKRVCQEQCRDSAQYDMGTTLTLALIVADQLHVAHVGDSRAYLIGRSGPASLMTTDHTLVERLIATGLLTRQAVAAHPQRHVLYRWIGAQQRVVADMVTRRLAPGDTVLLCSDGLTRHVGDGEIAEIVRSEASLELACARLVALASMCGGEDNISVAIIRTEVVSASAN